MFKNVKKTIKILKMLPADGWTDLQTDRPTEQGVESRARD